MVRDPSAASRDLSTIRRIATQAASGTGSRTTDGERAARAWMRRTSFLYDDGVVLCATLRGLDQIGILESSLASELSIADLLGTDETAGYGRLRAGLRSLAGQGWISPELNLRPETTYLRWTE